MYSAGHSQAAFSWVGLLLLYFWGDEPMSLRLLIIWLIITVVVTVLDYLVPPYFTKITGGSSLFPRSSGGAFCRLDILPSVSRYDCGAFIGALVAELINGNRMGQSLKAALGSFLGFIFGTFLKIVASVIMMVYIVKFL